MIGRSTSLLRGLSTGLSIFLAAAGQSAATTNGLTYETLAVTGDPAPGTEPGTVFSAFTGPYTHPEPTPRIDAQGRVTFFALLTGPAATQANHSGIWSQGSGPLALVARAGAQAPGAAPGVLFRAFTEDFAPSTPDIGNGRTGFVASLAGPGVTGANSTGVWVKGPDALQVFARMGSQAPGVPAGALFYEPLYVLDASDPGPMMVGGRLTGSGVSTANDEGFWSDRSGAPALIVREGQQAPGTPSGVVFGSGQGIGSAYTFPIVRTNHAGEIAMQADLLGPGVGTFSNEAVFAERSGQLKLIMREGDPAPGVGQGATFGGNSVKLQMYDLSFNTLGQVAFDVMLGGSRSGMTLLYSDHTGSLLPVAMPHDPAPGTNGREFGIMVDPNLSDGGRIAFRAALADAGMYPPIGLWWDQPGQLSALVVPGQQVPGRPPGITFASVHWVNGFTPAGQIAFTAQFEDAPAGTFPMALVLASPDGEMRIVAQADQPFDVRGDGSDVRTIADVRAGGLSENGVLTFRLDFTNNTSGIFTARWSAAPGAAGGLLVHKTAGGQILLDWDPDCGGGNRYGIYRGDLVAGITSVAPVTGTCAVAGTSASIPAGAGAAEFFLVVPNTGGFEGSYGTNSLGEPRPQALEPCYPRDLIDTCQP